VMPLKLGARAYCPQVAHNPSKSAGIYLKINNNQQVTNTFMPYFRHDNR